MMVLPFCVNFVALLSRFSRIWFRRKKVLAGGGNLVQVFLHLVRLIDVGGSQSLSLIHISEPTRP